MLREDKLNNRERRKMLESLVDLILSVMRETLECSNNMLRLVISKNNRIIGIMRESNNKKKSSIELFHLKFLMSNWDSNKSKPINSGDSNRIRLRETLLNKEREMLKEEQLKLKMRRKELDSPVDLILSAMRETLECNNSMQRLVTSKNSKIYGIMRENNNRKRSTIEQFHQKYQMINWGSNKNKQINSGDNNRIRLREIWLIKEREMLKEEQHKLLMINKVQEVALTLNAMRETLECNNSMQRLAISKNNKTHGIMRESNSKKKNKTEQFPQKFQMSN